MTYYYTRISYYDQDVDEEHYDTEDEAAEAYRHAIEARADAGRQFGDCSRISWGIVEAGKLQPINATNYYD
jgi:hypothetical protein